MNRINVVDIKFLICCQCGQKMNTDHLFLRFVTYDYVFIWCFH